LNDLLDAKLSSEDYDTLGGYVYALLDKIPTVGDTVTSQDFTFTVIATKGRRVTKVKVVRRVGNAGADEREDGQTQATDADSTGPVGVPEGPAEPAPAAQAAGEDLRDAPATGGSEADRATPAGSEPPPPPDGGSAASRPRAGAGTGAPEEAARSAEPPRGDGP